MSSAYLGDGFMNGHHKTVKANLLSTAIGKLPPISRRRMDCFYHGFSSGKTSPYSLGNGVLAKQVSFRINNL
jgi:hypothetical protein